MKRVFLLLAFIHVALCLYSQDGVADDGDHVLVTLNDGRVVEGYVQTYWTQGKLFKRMNTSFTMSPKPDGENAEKYDADGVKAIDFVKKTSADGRYDHLESHLVANPSTFSPKRVLRQFVCVEGENAVGRMYWWNGVDSQKMQLGKMNISTIYGVCLRGDSVIVPFMTGNVVSLNAMRIRYKKTNPGLVDYVDRRILKGGRRLWEDMAYRPMLFLEICEEYFSRQSDGRR